jgi:hypothetical protein
MLPICAPIVERAGGVAGHISLDPRKGNLGRDALGALYSIRQCNDPSVLQKAALRTARWFIASHDRLSVLLRDYKIKVEEIEGPELNDRFHNAVRGLDLLDSEIELFCSRIDELHANAVMKERISFLKHRSGRFILNALVPLFLHFDSQRDQAVKCKLLCQLFLSLDGRNLRCLDDVLKLSRAQQEALQSETFDKILDAEEARLQWEMECERCSALGQEQPLPPPEIDEEKVNEEIVKEIDEKKRLRVLDTEGNESKMAVLEALVYAAEIHMLAGGKEKSFHIGGFKSGLDFDEIFAMIDWPLLHSKPEDWKVSVTLRGAQAPSLA